MEDLRWLGIDDDEDDDERGYQEPPLPEAISEYLKLVKKLNRRGDMSLAKTEWPRPAMAAIQTARQMLVVTRAFTRQVMAERRALGLPLK